MINQRSEGIVNNYHKYTYHILGCGAIGSSVAIQLVRMGAQNLYLYDMDKVEDVNIGISQFETHHITLPKVIALQAICKSINPTINAKVIDGYFKEYKVTGQDIVILGFDSMKSRLDAVKSILLSRKPEYLLDARMGGQTMQLYTFVNLTLSNYKKTWYSDAEGNSDPCNAKGTSYCSNMIGSFVADTIKKILNKEIVYKEIMFDFPSYQFEQKYPVKLKSLN